jgi:hypothetical protein
VISILDYYHLQFAFQPRDRVILMVILSRIRGIFEMEVPRLVWLLRIRIRQLDRMMQY